VFHICVIDIDLGLGESVIRLPFECCSLAGEEINDDIVVTEHKQRALTWIGNFCERAFVEARCYNRLQRCKEIYLSHLYKYPNLYSRH
jgi:hypothetical protein